MPSIEKAMSITAKPSPNIGTMSDTNVTTNESSTVFLRPMRFIKRPVGTEKIRNQKNTSEGKRLACASVSPKSFCT